VPGLQLLGAWPGEKMNEIILDTHHQIDHGYQVKVSDFVAADGGKLDPLFAVALFTGHAPASISRLDARLPKKSVPKSCPN
jgi:hypothetical protein